MDDIITKLKEHPEFAKLYNLVTGQNPFQRKKIETFVLKQDEEYWRFADELSQTLSRSLQCSDKSHMEVAKAYNRMCMGILREQIRFRKTGTYLLEDADLARETVYNQKEIMQYYITGLLLSYLFWPNHYKMIRFFKEHLENIRVENCLEVGAGHGLFAAEVMRRFINSKMTILDISETSISLVQEMTTAFRLDSKDVSFVQEDFLTSSLSEGGFDFIIMGEVLEHVKEAKAFLHQALRVLSKRGTVFLSTCVNCPAIDHIYHFHTVDEIRDLVMSAGFTITRDLAMPAEDMPASCWQTELVTINYCSILARA